MSLLHGPIYQVAWVVRDIAASERWLSSTLGIPAWTRFENVHCSPDTWSYRGEPADYTMHVALGYAGRQQVELIQPVEGVNLYTEYLEQSGPGLHHVAYLVDDLEATVAAAAASGVEVVQRGTLAGCEYAYLDGEPVGAGYIELMRLSDDMRRFFDSLIPPDAAP